MSINEYIYKTRKLIKPEDLNARGTLFGGQLLKWIDEEAAIYAMCQLDTPNIVTRAISKIDFVAPAQVGDVIEIGVTVVSFGRTSITLSASVRNKNTKQEIINIDTIVFVCVNEMGVPTPHFKTTVTN